MWPRRNKRHPDADAALFMADKHLEEVESRRPEVDEIVAKSVQSRHQNHFAQQFAILLNGGKHA